MVGISEGMKWLVAAVHGAPLPPLPAPYKIVGDDDGTSTTASEVETTSL